jgi:hypothetical protein
MKTATLIVSALFASGLNMYFSGKYAGVDLSPAAFVRDWDWVVFFQFILCISILVGAFVPLWLLGKSKGVRGSGESAS